jgi:hypothetical protein
VDYKRCRAFYEGEADIIVIDILSGVEAVVDLMVQCECTASSSLHGLICSHAYGISSGWIRFSDDIAGGYFKYHDYYQSVGIMEPLEPRWVTEKIPVEDLSEWVYNYPQPKFPIETDSIMELCPFK